MLDELPGCVLSVLLTHAGISAAHSLLLTCKRLSTLVEGNVEFWDSVFPTSRTGSAQIGCVKRRSKRLKQTPLRRARSRYSAAIKRTEYFQHEISQWSHSGWQVSLSKLRARIKRWEPILINHVNPVYGSTLLHDTCRARTHVEGHILRAVREFVTKHGADVNVTSVVGNVTPLCIAAGRGLPKVVKFLLDAGATTEGKCKTSFCTFGSRQVVKGTYTAKEWAQAMVRAETTRGVAPEAIRSLEACVKLLAKAEIKGNSGNELRP